MRAKANKTAEAGIGTLILFIAFILVAAIAAAVLINTSGTLQNKALLTGSRTQKQVSSGISVLSIYGENSSAVPQINYIYSTVRLQAGSDPVDLNSSFVEIFSGAMSQSYNFNQSGNCTPAWLSNTTLSLNQFGVERKENYARVGILQEGDVILTCVRLPVGLNESQYVTWQFSPKQGAFTRVKTQTPNVMASAKVFLFP